MRRLGRASILAGICAMLTVTALAPARAADQQVRYYNTTLTSLGQAGTASTLLTLPPGTKAVAFDADVVTPGTAGGKVTVTVADSSVTLDARTGGPVHLDLETPLEDELPVRITNNYTLISDGRCTVDTTTPQTLKNISVTLTGTPTVPDTVAGFLGASVRSITIIPSDYDTDADAVMQLASTLGTLYGNETDITVGQTAAATGPDSRIIRVTTDPDTDVTLTVDTSTPTPTMTMTGSSQALAGAAIGLGNDANALANNFIVTDLSGDTATPGRTTRTFAQAGSGDISVSVRGSQSAGLGVDQAAYNAPVGSYTLHVQGTNTPAPPGMQARVNLLWNNTLLASTLLTEEDTWNLDAIVEAPARAGQVVINVEAADTNGRCGGPGLPMRVDVDTTKSTITATRGQGLPPGFARFPQVVTPVLPVAFGSTSPSLERLNSAAQILVALARTSPVPLTVKPVTFSEAAQSSSPAVIIGADEEDTNTLEAPLRMANWRAVDAAGGQYTVTVDGPYAALEAYEQNGRDLLILARTAEAEKIMTDLATSVNALEFGWASLDSDLYVALPGEEPFTLTTARLVPQDEVINEFRTIPTWVWILVIVVISALGLRWWLVRNRRTRIATRVNAEKAAMGEGPRSSEKP